jgi:hypothetical protein
MTHRRHPARFTPFTALGTLALALFAAVALPAAAQVVDPGPGPSPIPTPLPTPTPTPTPTPPPPCPDADNDGYVQCGSACTTPADKQCGDCDDADAQIYLRAVCAVCSGPGCPASFCVPGSTNRPCPESEGDRNQNDGFCLSVSANTAFFCSNNAEQSCESSADCDGGTCVPVVVPDPTRGLVCDSAGNGASCTAPPHVNVFTAEGVLANDFPARRAAATCGDGGDNDCDGLVDVLDPQCQTPEICDARDNDGDESVDEGFEVGGDCFAGSGACRTAGNQVCSPDGTGTVCDAVPSAGSFEGPFGNLKCRDGVDNDCDGLTDFPADASCVGNEVCDGLDNDGDGTADDGFDVGEECTVGVSSCQSKGVKICAANGAGTICNAVAKLGTVEGPGRPGSCTDQVDNDCDGAADGEDAGCGNAALRATCALPLWDAPARGGVGPGRDCDSTHIIVFDQPDGAQVKGELLALNTDGTVLGAIPVQSGELAHFVSKKDVDKLALSSENVGGAMTHHVFAPMPMLRVTSSDGVNTTTAYCTSIPYVQMDEPRGGVISLNRSANADEPDVVKVVVAIPRVDPKNVRAWVDNVDVIAALGDDGRLCTPATPCGGTLSIGGLPVTVSDLVVDVAPELGDPASNSLTMTLQGLGCGAHWVKVQGYKLDNAVPDRVARQCVVDDLEDKEFSYAFAIDITSPQPGSTGNAVPTRVTGQVCHGLPIDAVQLNGREIFDPTKMTSTMPETTHVTTFRFPISETVGQTNVARDIKYGDSPLGTFDPGSNFVVASAADAIGSRVFNNEVVFATEQTALPGVGSIEAGQVAIEQAMDPEVKAALESELSARLYDAFREVALETQSTIDVPNAFVVALDGDALTNFFAEKCSGPGPDGKTVTQRFQELADSKIRGRTFGPFSAPFPCSCDPSVTLRVNTVQFTSQLQCPVLFPGQTDPDGNVVPADTLRVVMRLPDVRVSVSGSDSCRDTFLGICIASAYASISLQSEVKNVRLKFDITEAQLEGTAPPGAASFNAGVSSNVAGSLSVNTDVGCIGGDICEALVSIFTFGLIDVTPNISVDRAVEFAKEIGQAEPDPIALKEIKLDEEEIANFGQTVRGDLVDVNISPQGLRASLKGRFSTNHVDPEIVANPGTWLEMPPTPELPLPATLGGANDGAVLVNADAINMMFASLTLSGKLKSECNASLDPDTGHPRTLGSLLPADCESLAGPNATAAALGQGFCHGLKEANCETLLGGNLLATPIEQGICHGLQGDDCGTIAAGFDGTAMPDDCDSLVIGSADSDDPSRATLIVQGRCWGRKPGTDCSTLTAPDSTGQGYKQGACYGQQGAVCADLPGPGAARKIGTCAAVQGIPCGEVALLQRTHCTAGRIQVNLVEGLLKAAEQKSCGLTPSLGVNANQPLLFCARQDLPPRFLVRDEPATSDVEVGLRLNDLSLAIVVDRDLDNQLAGQLSATPPCFGEGSTASGDCSLAALCLDLNFIAAFELADSECPATGGVAKPGFKARIVDVQPLQRLFGAVCGGLPAGDDATALNEATAGNASIDTLRLNAESFSPPACIQGLTLGGFVTFQDPTIFALRTGAPRSVCENDGVTTCTSNAQCGGGTCVPIQNYIGISTKIVP